MRKGCVHITVKLTKLTKPFIVLQEKSQSGVTKLTGKQECELVCGFVVCSRVLLFAVIGPNTIKITSVPDFVGLTVTSIENCAAMAPGENLTLNKLNLLEFFAVSTELYMYIISHRSRNDGGPKKVHTRI